MLGRVKMVRGVVVEYENKAGQGQDGERGGGQRRE